MKSFRELVTNTVVGGVLVILPVYLAVLLLLKGMQIVASLVAPVAALIPGRLLVEPLLSLLLVLFICFAVGLAVRTPLGRAARERFEVAFFGRLPGYALFRSLTQRLAGKNSDDVWKPALVEIEDALVPAFIIEDHGDGRFTVFVPSAPTPLAGAVYVLDGDRVHAIDVPFTQALQAVSRWGYGSRDLVAAMKIPAVTVADAES